MTQPPTDAPYKRALRAAHERKAELLTSPDSVEAGRYYMGHDSSAAALFTRLHRLRVTLWTEAERLYVDYQAREDDCAVVVPALDLPEPDDFDSLRFAGMRLVRGEIGDRYRVALLSEFTVWRQ